MAKQAHRENLEERPVLDVYAATKFVEKTAAHFRWPRVLIKRALAYAKALPEEVARSREGETGAATDG